MTNPYRMRKARGGGTLPRAWVVGVMVAALAAPVAARATVVTLTPVKDNTLIEDATGSVSNGAGSWFFSGKTNQGKTGKLRRALIQFDLSSIPTTATISAVTLTLANDRGKPGTFTMGLHRVLASWGEGTSNSDANPGAGVAATTNDATWLHRFYNTQTWSTPGGDFNPVASASAAVGGSANYSWSSAQMVSDVQQWVSNPATNFGWLLLGDESAKQTTRRFRSRTGTVAPTLQVTYTGSVVNGACCLPDFSCQVLTPSECSAASGTYHGDGTVCTPSPCVAPTGACCAANGTCSTVTQTQCASSGGTYQGDNTSCSPNPCPVVLTPFLDPLPLPAVATPVSGTAGQTATYEISVTQFTQQLHSQLPATTVWGFGGSYPGPTIEASTDQPVTVTWLNDLRDSQGTLRTTHYLAVDTCLTGPLGVAPRTITHLHGGHVPPIADGYPESAFPPGQQITDVYPNHQHACTLWYHDHAMAITRLNTMMGMAGFYIVRDAVENALGLPSGAFEIALAIQDRTFNPDGSLQYPTSWQEDFFGDKVLVNGKVWPYLNVQRGKYRFRILDGSNSRVYTLSLSNGAGMWVIGDVGGLLPAPVYRSQLTVTPGERYDVVMDFAPYAPGTEIVLQNSAPAPYPGSPGVGVIPNVMKFVVVPGGNPYTAPLPATLRTVDPIPENEAVQARTFELYKIGDDCTGQKWSINGLGWSDVTEFPVRGTTEIWRFVNRSGMTHPMHMHLVEFQVLDRQPFVIVADTVQTSGPPVPPDSSERGWKDTAPVGPLEILRVIARFEDYTGFYPYHCHILEHEDNEMMRQFQVVEPAAVPAGAPARGVVLGPSVPNPTSGPTRISLLLPQAARVRLTIEDIAGRRIAVLADERMTGGRHQVLWDGRISGAGSAAPGIYFVRVAVDGRTAGTRRMVMLQ